MTRVNWTTHLDHLSNKLSAACYAIRILKHLFCLRTLIIIYYAYFYSLMNYGLFLWGNSPHSIQIFRLQKKVPYFSVDNARVIYTKKLKFGKIRTCELYIRKRHEGSQIQ
jgi:hypothetical protein